MHPTGGRSSGQSAVRRRGAWRPRRCRRTSWGARAGPTVSCSASPGCAPRRRVEGWSAWRPRSRQPGDCDLAGSASADCGTDNATERISWSRDPGGEVPTRRALGFLLFGVSILRQSTSPSWTGLVLIVAANSGGGPASAPGLVARNSTMALVGPRQVEASWARGSPRPAGRKGSLDRARDCRTQAERWVIVPLMRRASRVCGQPVASQPPTHGGLVRQVLGTESPL